MDIIGKRRTPVLDVQDLVVEYTTKEGPVRAVRGISFQIHRGETLGLAGESGCGKSTVAFAVMKYLARNGRVARGRVLFRGEDILSKSGRALNRIRGNHIAMVYQDPQQALNPSMRIGQQLTEVLTEHQKIARADARAECLAMLERVRMPAPAAIMKRYPHELSGGQQQRVVIAMALLTRPELLVMDEPTTGLDVTVEATVLDLIADLKHELGATILYITHNLGVMSRVADRVGVMYAGEIVEVGAVKEIFANPRHPYTAGLLACVPRIGVDERTRVLQPIRGSVPSLRDMPEGCAFASRCSRASLRCRAASPEMREVAPGHLAACFRASEPRMAPAAAPRRQLTDAGAPEAGGQPILRVEELKSYYRGGDGGLLGGGNRRQVKAVDGVDLTAWKGSTVGIVGESGCGKSTLIKAIAGLMAPTDGDICFLGSDVAKVVEKRPRRLLQDLQMVFQNPDSTLNPSTSVGEAIARPLRLFSTVPAREVRSEVVRLLKAVRLGEGYYDRLPRRLSGGEKQRVAIARAFAGRPSLVLCDEPVSSLDVSVQAAVINLLLELQRKYGTTILLISHDLSVVHQLCDRVAVMYLGRFCETALTEDLFAPPYHPYTEALLSAVPIPDPSVEKKRIRLSGTVPSAANPPTGCTFHTRCPHRIGAICEEERPPWREPGGEHRIRCHLTLEQLRAMAPVIQA